MFIEHDLFFISWKSDLNTSLAALELLSGLARIPIPEQGEYNKYHQMLDLFELQIKQSD